MAAQSVAAVREIQDSEDCFTVGVLPGVGPIVSNCGSGLQVWDRELRPVSRHRLKGNFTKVLSSEGRTFILAFADSHLVPHSGGSDARMRLFELRENRK